MLVKEGRKVTLVVECADCKKYLGIFFGEEFFIVDGKVKCASCCSRR